MFESSQTVYQRLGVIINPTKPVVGELRAAVVELARQRQIEQVHWLETTKNSPGTAQARTAQASQVDLVIAAGGDGTVRAVAQGLAGSTTPLGIIPLGTGNLLARNLGLPLQGLHKMVAAALDGNERRIDIGRISAWGSDDQLIANHQTFLVIAGLGFDAVMVATTDPALKARLGWAAYLMAGMANLVGPRLKLRVSIDGRQRRLAARSIMAGNCGRLPGGLTLLPDAALDDGKLDIALLDTHAGLVGWAALAAKVALQGVGVRRAPGLGTGKLIHAQGKAIHIEADHPHLLEIDGELIGHAKRLTIQVQPAALTVKI